MIPAEQTNSSPARVLRVLVVDDSRAQRMILVLHLRRWGYQVIEAGSGEEALALCTTAPPDIVLSDWMMPGMSGLDLCRRIRDLPQEGYRYFILLTSKSEKTEVADGLEGGADDFLTKPVNPEELRARMRAGERIIGMQDELVEHCRKLAHSADWNRRRVEMLSRLQKHMRDPERTLVCDILANGQLLPDPHGKRYGFAATGNEHICRPNNLL